MLFKYTSLHRIGALVGGVQNIKSRSFNNLACIIESGTVTGTIPGLFSIVPVQLAA